MDCAENQPRLGHVIEEMLAAKTRANRRPTYVRQLRSYLNQFSRGRPELPIVSLNRSVLESWFASRNDKPITRRAGISFLSVLCSYCVRVGYLPNNPCSQLEPVYIDRQVPRILSTKEVRRILLYAKRHMRWRLPQLVLGIYAGIRPTELTRLYWKDIFLDAGYVRIDAAAAKTRQRRIVRLEPKAIAWLRYCEKFRKDHRPIGSNSDHFKKLIKRHCGVDWVPDILRHSAASYLLALHGDAGKVSRMLGNSVDVLLSRYMEIVEPADCRRFWKASFR